MCIGGGVAVAIGGIPLALGFGSDGIVSGSYAD